VKISRYGLDLLERAAATFVVTFAATWLPAAVAAGSSWGAITDLSIAQKAALAGAAAVLSLAKGWLAQYVGNADSASLLPTRRRARTLDG